MINKNFELIQNFKYEKSYSKYGEWIGVFLNKENNDIWKIYIDRNHGGDGYMWYGNAQVSLVINDKCVKITYIDLKLSNAKMREIILSEKLSENNYKGEL